MATTSGWFEEDVSVTFSEMNYADIANVVTSFRTSFLEVTSPLTRRS